MKKIVFPYGKTEVSYEKAKIIYVSDLSPDIVEKMHMIPAKALNEVIGLAKKLLAKEDATITAIPDGVSVVVV